MTRAPRAEDHEPGTAEAFTEYAIRCADGSVGKHPPGSYLDSGRAERRAQGIDAARIDGEPLYPCAPHSVVSSVVSRTPWTPWEAGS